MKAERQRHGLEPIAQELTPMTFRELFDWWMKEYGCRLRGDFEGFFRKRLVSHLGHLSMSAVTPVRIEGLLQSQCEELSPKSLNELRGNVHTLFRRATERGLWQGPNPAVAVRRRKVPRKLFATLRAEEVALVLAALTSKWRPLFAAAVWTGMRKGELLGLRKDDVDLIDGTITVRSSYDHETTKGGHADVIPIAGLLRPYLAEAMLASCSEYVFPDVEGKMRTRETKLQAVLQRALARAGLVRAYLHVCRGRGCGHREQTHDGDTRHCPKCGRKLRSRGLPRPMRFHDLRGTTATLLARNGVPLVVAQRILRHTDPRLTANVYSRVDLADLRSGIDRIAIPQCPAPSTARTT